MKNQPKSSFLKTQKEGSEQFLYVERGQKGLVGTSEATRDHLLQKRFKNYLRSYRLDKAPGEAEITQDALAAELNCAPSLIPKYESSTPYSRLIRSYEFFEQFAKLQGRTVTEFCSFLERSFIQEKSNDLGNLLDLIADKINSNNVFAFKKILEKSDDISYLNTLMRILISIDRMEPKDKEAFISVFHKLTSKD